MQEETAQEYKHTRGLESPKVTLEPGHPPLMPLVFQSVSSYRGPRSTVLSGLPAITQSFLYRNLVQHFLTLHSMHSMPFSLRNLA